MGPPVSARRSTPKAIRPTPGLGFARKLGVGLRRARAGRHAEGQVPVRTSGTFAAAPPSTCCRTCSAEGAARSDVPEADALGRAARGRQGRVPVRPADPLAAVPLRRPRRAVHDRAAGAGVEPARAGRDVGRGDLRPPVPRDERPRRPRHQGPQLRRVPQEAHRELRDPLAHRAARPHHARPRGAGAPHRRPRDAAPARAGRGAARGSAGSRRVPGGRGRRVQRGVPRRCPPKC